MFSLSLAVSVLFPKTHINHVYLARALKKWTRAMLTLCLFWNLSYWFPRSNGPRRPSPRVKSLASSPHLAVRRSHQRLTLPLIAWPAHVITRGGGSFRSPRVIFLLDRCPLYRNRLSPIGGAGNTARLPKPFSYALMCVHLPLVITVGSAASRSDGLRFPNHVTSR